MKKGYRALLDDPGQSHQETEAQRHAADRLNVRKDHALTQIDPVDTSCPGCGFTPGARLGRVIRDLPPNVS